MIRSRENQLDERDTFDAHVSDVAPPAEPLSHYVPAFTAETSATKNRHGKPSRRLQSVCGEWIDYPQEHSAEPTCDECRAYLERDPNHNKTADEIFG